MAHGVTPRVAAGGARAHAGRARRVHRLADLLRHVRRRRRLRRGRARRRRRRSSSTSPGARTSASTRELPASALDARRRRRAHEHAQARRLAHAERDPAPRPQRPRSTPTRVGARRAHRALDEPVLAAARLARRRAPPARGARRAAAARDARGDRRRARQAARDRGRRPARPGSSSGGPGSPPTTRCGSCSTRAAPAAPASSSSDVLRQSYDVHAELATQSTIVFVVGLGERPETLLRLAGDVDEVVKRMRAGRAARRSRSSSRPRRPSSASRRATRSSATPSCVAVDDAVGRISCESIAGYPPGIPALLPGRADHGRDRALPARDGRRGRAPARGAATPAFETVFVLRERPRPAVQRTSTTGLPTAPPSAKPASSRARVLERRTLADDRAQLPLRPPAHQLGVRGRRELLVDRQHAAVVDADDVDAAQQQPVDRRASGSSRWRTRSRGCGPPGAVQRRLWSKRSPPTGSTTRSAPRPPVAARTSATQSSAGSSAMSAPACVATRRRSASEPSAITVPAPAALRDLDRRRSDTARGAVHEHRLAGLHPSAAHEREVRGLVVDDHAGGDVERHVVRDREGDERRRERHLGEAAERRRRGHALPLLQPAARRRGEHDARDLRARDERQVRLDLVLAARDQPVDEPGAGRVHLDQREAVTGVRLRDLLQPQRLRARRCRAGRALAWRPT